MDLDKLGPYIFIAVTLVFITVLIFGSKWNQRMLKEGWDRVARNLAPHSENIGGKIGHNLFRMTTTPKKETPFKKVSAIMCTQDRENAFHYLLRYIRDDEDLLMLMGDIYGLRTVPKLELVPTTARVLPGRVKMRIPVIKDATKFSTKEFGYKSEFLVFTKSRELVQHVFKNKGVQDTVEQAADLLDRISIAEESPHILVTWKVQLPKISQAVDLFYALGNSVRQYTRRKTS